MPSAISDTAGQYFFTWVSLIKKSNITYVTFSSDPPNPVM